MKKIFYLLLSLTIVSCARFGKDDAEIVEPLPSYIKELFVGNKDCIPQPSFGLRVEQKFYSTANTTYDNYTDQSFQNFDVNNGIFYIQKEGFYNLFPNFIKQNETVVANGGNYTVKDISPRLQIQSHLPKSYLNNLKTGSYVLNNDSYLTHILGFEISINIVCSLNENPNYSYCAAYNVDLKKPYQFNIDCIDRSDLANVKISGKFEGTFTPNMSENPNVNMAESKFIKGNFSYIFR